MTTKAAKRLLVTELPVCPVEGCENVGKIASSEFQGKNFCIGSKNKRHPRKAMELRKFREMR